DTHRRESEMPINEHPIAKRIYEVRRNEREHDWIDYIGSLQIPAQGEVGEQRQCAPIERREKGPHRLNQFRADSEALHQGWPEEDGTHQDGGEKKGYQQPIEERAARIDEILSTVSVRYERVQAKEKPSTKKSNAVIKGLAQTRSADSNCAIWQPPHHDRVDNPHAHPADLSEGKRESKA